GGEGSVPPCPADDHRLAVLRPRLAGSQVLRSHLAGAGVVVRGGQARGAGWAEGGGPRWACLGRSPERSVPPSTSDPGSASSRASGAPSGTTSWASPPTPEASPRSRTSRPTTRGRGRLRATSSAVRRYAAGR